MTYSSHVAHEYKNSVFFFFLLKGFALRIYNVCNAILARNKDKDKTREK